MKFPGQAILFAPVTAGNPIHRPHKKTNLPNIWRDYVEEIIQEAPPKLRNHAVFKHDYIKTQLVSIVTLINLYPHFA